MPRASVWLDALEANDAALVRTLASCYGSSAIAADRTSLLRRVLNTFVASFGDAPVRVFRCPARLNLRGMHVDTHGGHLNLMTHQREVFVVSTASADSASEFVNIDATFQPVRCDLTVWSRHSSFDAPWPAFITHEETQRHVRARRGSWANYLEGSLLRARREWRDVPLRGIRAAVGSDIPRGASLSSSTALCLAVYSSVCAWNGKETPRDALIPIAQDIEWFTGARIGTSDQSGMLVPRANELVHFAPEVSRAVPADVRRVPFPDALGILVINSHTERSISGAEQIDYTRNRFAYSLALEILRQEMVKSGVPYERVEMMTRLCDFAAPNLTPFGGARALYRWLLRVPQSLSLVEIRARYTLPALDETYARYFSPLPEYERPDTFAIRGPLLFGIAESERARLFVDALLLGDHEVTGYYMTLGHDGDRRFDAMGIPWSADVSDAELQLLAQRETPVARVPGAYGASSRALDALVDCAVHAGALGASLTGAGIAGTVIALVESAYADRIADAIRTYIAGPAYRALAPKVGNLTENELRESVVLNMSPNAACEITMAAG